MRFSKVGAARAAMASARTAASALQAPSRMKSPWMRRPRTRRAAREPGRKGGEILGNPGEMLMKSLGNDFFWMIFLQMNWIYCVLRCSPACWESKMVCFDSFTKIWGNWWNINSYALSPHTDCWS